jgi:hypothetical protein
MLCKQAELTVIPAKMLHCLSITGGAAEKSFTNKNRNFLLNMGT